MALASIKLLFSCLLILVFTPSLASASTTGTGVHYSLNSNSDWTQNMIIVGNTSIINDILQLTSPSPTDSCSWATYHNSIPLLDVNGQPASFRTHFSFIINATGNISGDGFTFFLAPFPFVNPANSCGGDLGLYTITQDMDSSRNKLVAVEFDTYYQNAYDPQFYHVGIDVNSIYSVVVHELPASMTHGTLAHAWVSYDAGDQTLNVSLNYNGTDDSDSPQNQILSYKIDLVDTLATEVAVGFSAATGFAMETHQILSWEFNSTYRSSNNTVPLPTSPTPTPPPTHSPSNKPVSTQIKAKLIIIIIIPCSIAAVTCFGGGIWFFISRKKSLKKGDSRQLPKKFGHKKLAMATSGFAEKNKLGEGGFGTVYKGYLRDSCDEVAVKTLKQGSSQGPREFNSEVQILSKLTHKNLVELFGWCAENGQLLLVYKYMPNGSLSSLLYDRHRLLLWHKRYVIACNLADVLCYLHIENECRKEVVHRDIKPDNILLDSNLEAKLGDFGLARLVDPEISARATRAAGTTGYIAPELLNEFGIIIPSSKSDVYSFGVVLLEIACGRKPTSGLIDFVWEHYGRDELLKAADERLKGEYNAREMERVMYVGLWCSHPDPSRRPTVAEAKEALNFTIDGDELPNLPRTKPVPDWDHAAMLAVILDEHEMV